MNKKALSTSVTLSSFIAAQLLFAIPCRANPADVAGQPCSESARISFQDPNPALVCAGDHWAEMPSVQVAADQTIGKPCNLLAGTTAIGADPVTDAPYLVMCYQGAWGRYQP